MVSFRGSIRAGCGLCLLLCKLFLDCQLKSLSRYGCLTDFLAFFEALRVCVAQASIVNLLRYILQFLRLGEVMGDDELNELVIREPLFQA